MLKESLDVYAVGSAETVGMELIEAYSQIRLAKGTLAWPYDNMEKLIKTTHLIA